MYVYTVCTHICHIKPHTIYFYLQITKIIVDISKKYNNIQSTVSDIICIVTIITINCK